MTKMSFEAHNVSILQDLRLQSFDTIRFASYRTASKLRYIQKSTNREYCQYSLFENMWPHGYYQNFNQMINFNYQISFSLVLANMINSSSYILTRGIIVIIIIYLYFISISFRLYVFSLEFFFIIHSEENEQLYIIYVQLLRKTA